MNAIKTLAALVYFLNRAYAASVNCVDAVLRDDSACDGTAASPCEAKIAGVEVGTFVELDYHQPKLFGPCNPNGELDCEVYNSAIHVKVTGEPTGTADIELTQYGMMALCNEACLDAGVFVGLCQHDLDPVAHGCQWPADSTNVCGSNVLLQGDTDIVSGSGRCEPIGAAPGTKACSIDDPCEVKVLGGTVRDLLQITYDQPISDGTDWGGYCKDDTCEAYQGIIHAVVVAGSPLATQVELDRNGMDQICTAACSNAEGGFFGGVCQSDASECKGLSWPEPCGLNLAGTFQYETVGTVPISTLTPETTTVPKTTTLPDTTTVPEPTTVPVVPETTTVPEPTTAPGEGEDNSSAAEDSTAAAQTTSGAEGAIVGLTLIGLLMTA